MNSGQKHSAQPASPPPLRPQTPPPLRVREEGRDQPPHLGRYIVAGVLLGAVPALTGLVILILLFGGGSHSSLPELPSERVAAQLETKGKSNERQAINDKPADVSSIQDTKDLLQDIERSGKSSQQPEVKTETVATITPTMKKPAETSTPTNTKAVEKTLPPALEDVRRRQRLLELPERGVDAVAAMPPRRELAHIHVRKPTECELAFVEGGQDSEKTQLSPFELRVEDDPASSARFWKVSRKSKDPLGTEQVDRIGHFSLKDQVLTFAWEAHISPQARAGELYYVPLVVKAGEEQETCSLLKPVEVDFVRVELKKRQQISLPLKVDSVTESSRISLDLSLDIPGSPTLKLTNLKPKEKQILRIPHKVAFGDGTVELEVVFQTGRRGDTVSGTVLLEPFVTQLRITPYLTETQLQRHVTQEKYEAEMLEKMDPNRKREIEQRAQDNILSMLQRQRGASTNQVFSTDDMERMVQAEIFKIAGLDTDQQKIEFAIRKQVELSELEQFSQRSESAYVAGRLKKDREECQRTKSQLEKMLRKVVNPSLGEARTALQKLDSQEAQSGATTGIGRTSRSTKTSGTGRPANVARDAETEKATKRAPNSVGANGDLSKVRGPNDEGDADSKKNLTPAEKQVALWELRKKQHEDAIAACGGNLRWCDEMEEFYDTICKESQLTLTVCLEFGQTRIPIVQTKAQNGALDSRGRESQPTSSQ